MRKLSALLFTALLACTILSVDRDPEHYQDLERMYTWSVYFHRWHDVPVFGADGKWNVMRDFDHDAHWKWQLEQMELQRRRDHESVAIPAP